MSFLSSLLKAIPGVGAGMSALSELLGGSSMAGAQKQALEQENANRQAQADLAKQFLAQYGSAMLGPSTSSSATTGGGTSAMHGVSTHKVATRPEEQAAEAFLRSALMGRAQGEAVTPEEKAAQLGEIARAREAENTAVSNALAGRNLPAGSIGAVMASAPANRAASAAAINARAGWGATNRAERAAGQEALGGFLGQRLGSKDVQDTTQNYTNFSNTSGQQFDPTRAYGALFDISRQTVPQSVSTNTGYNPWAAGLSGAGNLATGLSQYYGWGQQPNKPVPQSWNVPGGVAPIPKAPPPWWSSKDLGLPPGQ